MVRIRFLLASLMIAGAPLTIIPSASAQESPAPAPAIEATAAWSRPTIRGAKAGVAFVTLHNKGPADRLVGVEADVGKVAQIHMAEVVDGIARMRPLADGVALPAGGTVTLKPEGPHIMLMGLTQPLQVGQRVHLTLRFKAAAPLAVEAAVLAPGAEPGMGGGATQGGARGGG
ncbi:copper chaperone PCu(A)C [Nitrospirillum sp. BR 11163]|uniref:copper chaperone PCu(A)C n=1 Tax=Nitrospirillum sp. BR 11163 TaxID=3104323 RepID=UPI002AFFAA40|nr:copper chaperone PCu(A)C [Nitrospirillum sp. BR 11163]MEA1675748.1 copper chaperone PCu(A)C [Nitrospirillum sp. BR 11163]